MMVALVAVETVLLVVLVVLVAGLLRSHAELLRRVGPAEGGAGSDAVAGGKGGAGAGTTAGAGLGDGASAGVGLSGPKPGAREPRPVPLLGTTLDGDAVKLDFDGPARAPTLLAFLTSGCSSCARFWQELGEQGPPAGVQTVIVTRGGDRERPARLRSLAPAGIPVVMSSQAWDDYEVPGSPYFLLIDDQIRGEGVATTWEGLSSLVSDAIEDQRLQEHLPAGTRRARGVDQTLAMNGIGPDHPSLYPARPGQEHP
jgi:hypothetical protein